MVVKGIVYMKRLFKIMLKIFIIVLIIIVLAFLFIKLYKPFGSSPNKNDKNDYFKRSKIFKDGKFVNIKDSNTNDNYIDTFKDRTSGKDTTPLDEIPYKKYKYKKAKKDEVLITWFGHSSILIQMHGLNILVDPIFDKRSSPVSFVGPKRFSKVPVNINDLPKIDVILLTHDHYDHVSYKTLLSLEDKTTKFIVPLGIDKDLEKFGISKDKIQNMAWYEEINIDGLSIISGPGRHFSGRYIFDHNDTLWSSWILKDEYHSIFDSGDTGYGNHFKEVYEKYGQIDFAILDGSQYNEKWHGVHMFPEESVEASLDLHSKVSMVNHYGAYVLSNHSWDDPVERFTRRCEEKNVEYVAPLLGETFNIDQYKDYQTKWWKDIK